MAGLEAPCSQAFFYHLRDIKRAVCIHLDNSVCDEEVGAGASSYEDGGDACLLVEIAGAFDERGDRLFIAADDALHQVVPQHEVGSGGVLVDQESAGSCFNAFDHGCRLGGTAAGIGGGKVGGVFFVRQIPDKEGNINVVDAASILGAQLDCGFIGDDIFTSIPPECGCRRRIPALLAVWICRGSRRLRSG